MGPHADDFFLFAFIYVVIRKYGEIPALSVTYWWAN